MYSVVLMAALTTTAAEAPACWGCRGYSACYGCSGCYGGGYGGCYGCWGGCWGSCYGGYGSHWVSSYGCHGCYGCYGCYGCNGYAPVMVAPTMPVAPDGMALPPARGGAGTPAPPPMPKTGG